MILTITIDVSNWPFPKSKSYQYDVYDIYCICKDSMDKIIAYMMAEITVIVYSVNCFLNDIF